MCRMALVLGKEKAMKGFELAFKSAWASGNDDGVGCYWRDYPKTKATEARHLARMPRSDDMARIETTYDRMLIHFRKSTKGIGTHPFICRDRLDLGSENWLLVHNGSVDDTKARGLLKKDGHVFATGIDSEIFVHIWGEINEKNLVKRAQRFADAVDSLDVKGWANLIFYNVVTDEWVALAENALELTRTKSKEILVISSDVAWLDETQAAKAGIHVEHIPYGAMAYGKGVEVKGKEKVWALKSRTQTTLVRGQSCEDAAFDSSGAEAYESRLPRREPEAGWRWNANMRAMVDERGQPVDFEKYSNAENHEFVPQPKDPTVCDVCYMSKSYHSVLTEVRQRAEENAIEEIERWEKKHPFTRDHDYTKGIRCMCSLQSGYGGIHFAHDFERLGGSDYCIECGQTREIGNHRESNPNNHDFHQLLVQISIGVFESTGTCVRCGQTEASHKKAKTIPNDAILTKIWPTGCKCRAAAKEICIPHHKLGYTEFDDKGMLVKITSFSMGAS